METAALIGTWRTRHREPTAEWDFSAFGSAIDADEITRVLTPGGVFLTQQVDGRDLAEARKLFGGGEDYPLVRLPVLREEAERAGLIVEDAREWTGAIVFADVAALVSYLRMVPWQVPDDFTVDRCADELLALHRSGRPPRFTQRRFVLRCRRPFA